MSPDEQTPLGQAIEQRWLVELDMSWTDLADITGLAGQTILNVRRRVAPLKKSSSTDRRIEDALGWAHGSIQAILTGGEPTLSGQLPVAVTQKKAKENEQPRRRFGVIHGEETVYPEWVPDDPFARRIYDDPLASEDKKRAAIKGLVDYQLTLIEKWRTEAPAGEPSPQHRAPPPANESR